MKITNEDILGVIVLLVVWFIIPYGNIAIMLMALGYVLLYMFNRVTSIFKR